MRDRFIENLKNYIKDNSNTYFLTGDLGFGVIDKLYTKYPNNVINVGVSEQNMIGIASGLASRGSKVIVYSIGNFPTLRCLEQIRNDVSYHRYDVNIVSVGAGYSYGVLGVSHHATEDIGIMNTIPNIDIYSPSSINEVDIVSKEVFKSKGPSYIRLDKSMSSLSGKNLNGFNFIKKNNSKICFITTGGITEEIENLFNVNTFLKDKISIISLFRIKPLNKKKLKELLKDFKIIFTLEEHQINNGLGSIISNFIIDNNLKAKIHKFAINNKYSEVAGSQKYLRKLCGIDSSAIKKIILNIV